MRLVTRMPTASGLATVVSPFFLKLRSVVMVYLVAFHIDRFGGWNRGEYLVVIDCNYPTKGCYRKINCKLPY